MHEPEVEVERQDRGDDQREYVGDEEQGDADDASHPRGSSGACARNPGLRNEAVSQ